MAYSTVDAWKTTYPRLASTNATSATLYNWLVRASDLVDVNIREVVASVPVTPIPQLLITLTEDIAFSMFLKRNVHEASKEGAIAEMWKESMQILENLRNGIITIDGVTTSNRRFSPWFTGDGYVPTFDHGDIEDAQIDLDLLEAEEALKD